MKLLFLPPQPMLTKRGLPRKRLKTMSPGRLFFEDGREFPLVSRLSIESKPTDICSSRRGANAKRAKYVAALLTIEIDSPEVEIISAPPELAAPQEKK